MSIPNRTVPACINDDGSLFTKLWYYYFSNTGDLVKRSVSSGVTKTIPTDYQLVVANDFQILGTGNLIIEGTGSLAIL